MNTGLFTPFLRLDVIDQRASSVSEINSNYALPIYFIYNGSNENCASKRIAKNSRVIGFELSETIALEMSKLADYPKEHLFGEQIFNRSFGGSSNMILGISASLNINRILKVDEDCLDHTELIQLWLNKAIELPEKENTVFFGKYLEKNPKFHKHFPIHTLNQLIQLVYPQNKARTLLGSVSSSRDAVIKNGNIIIPLTAAKQACYPVLYHKELNIHGRGEVNYWARQLQNEGFKFRYVDDLQLSHNPDRNEGAIYWISALLLTYDLSYIDRAWKSTGMIPCMSERNENLMKFRGWVYNADWGDIDISPILDSISKEESFLFSEKIYFRKEERKKAWQRLISADKKSIAKKIRSI